MADTISKSEKKRQFKQVAQVAAELADFSENELKQLPGSDELKEEVRATRGLKAGSRKRQVKYLAKCLQQEPLADIYRFLEERKGSQLRNNQTFHEAERIRDAMINEGIAVQQQCREQHAVWEMNWPSQEISHALNAYPSLDETDVRKAVYSYVKSRNRMHYRELFRMVKAAIEQRQLQERLQAE